MLQRLKSSRFIRNVGILVTGTALAQFIPIAISPILTRFYTPDEFGLAAVCIAITSIASAVATGRYELAIVVSDKDRDAASLVALAVSLTLFFSMLSLIIIAAMNDTIASMIGNEALGLWLYAIPFSIFISGTYQSFNYWLNRQCEYRILVKNRIMQSSAASVSQLAGGGLSLGFGGLIAGTVLGQLLACFHLIKNSTGIVATFRNFSVTSEIIRLAKKFSNFPKYDVPSVFLSVLASQAPNILLASIFSPAVAGFYYLTQRALQAPITLISRSFLDVFKQRASEDYNNFGTARPIFIKTFLMLSAISLSTTVPLYFLIEDLFVFIFGVEWTEAGVYARLLLPALALRLIANPMSFMFYIANKQHLNLLVQFMMMASVAVSIIMSEHQIDAVSNISASMSFVYLVHIIGAYKLSVR